MDITPRIVRALNRACFTIANEYPTINCGGCAVFAVELNRRLMVNGITDGRLRVYDFSLRTNPLYEKITDAEAELRSYEANLGDVLNWNDAGVYFDHVVLEWNGTAWDAEGPVKFPDADEWMGSPIHGGELAHHVVDSLASRPANWNSSFDREDIPYIQQTLDNIFTRNKLRTK